MAYRVAVSERKYCHRMGETLLEICWEEERPTIPCLQSPCYSPETDDCHAPYYSPRNFMRTTTRSRRFYDLGLDAAGAHFLQACHLCKRALGEGDDIFMYRGDTPFCSEECRQKQIDVEEAKEKMWSSVKAMQFKKKPGNPLASADQEESASPSPADDLHYRAGTGRRWLISCEKSIPPGFSLFFGFFPFHSFPDQRGRKLSRRGKHGASTSFV